MSDSYAQKSSNWLRDLLASVLTTIAALGYILTFLYEVGYCNYYGLPVQLIRLDWTTILVAIGAVLLISFLIGWNAFVIAVYMPSRFKALKVFLIAVYSATVPALLYGSFTRSITVGSIPGLLFLIMFVIFILPSVIFGFINKETRENRERAVINWFKSLRSSTLVSFVTVIVLALLCVALISGQIVASNQITYLVPSTQPRSVVLRIYGDNVICSQTTDNITITHDFFVLRLNDPNLVLTSVTFAHISLAKR